MSHEIEERDRQCGLENAWHGLTTIVPEVTREIAHPFEVEPCPCPIERDGALIHEDQWYRLVATDDGLPVGPPYNPKTYSPSSIALFWTLIEEAMKDREYTVVSAGSVRDRQRIFASIQVSESFEVGNREFREYLNILDSFDGTASLQARYSNICVVCNNTFSASLNNGKQLGRAVHKGNLTESAGRIAKAVDLFFSKAEEVKKTLAIAFANDCTESEARCWLAAVDNYKKKKLTQSDVQRIARLTELFRLGDGNCGQNRLDAFQGLTQFHTHESCKRPGVAKRLKQFISSNFGPSNNVKERGLVALNDWDTYVAEGDRLLNTIDSNE